jgi:hypothetical protein
LPNSSYLLYYLYVSSAENISHLKYRIRDTEVLVKQLSSLKKGKTIKRNFVNRYQYINLYELVNEMEKHKVLSKRDAHSIKSHMQKGP